jgi:hypothetical protein
MCIISMLGHVAHMKDLHNTFVWSDDYVYNTCPTLKSSYVYVVCCTILGCKESIVHKSSGKHHMHRFLFIVLLTNNINQHHQFSMQFFCASCYLLLPAIGNKCRWLSINFVLSYYKVIDTYFRPKRVGYVISNLSIFTASLFKWWTKVLFLCN